MYHWAQLIQWRKHVLYATPTLLWSFFFLVKFFETTYSLGITLTTILFLLLQHLIGWLLFPSLYTYNYHDKYTYIDVYETLRQNRLWVFGIAFIAEWLHYYTHWMQGSSSSLVFPLLFLCAAFTEHKGLMLLWVWLGLGYLVGL
ncbi:MAG: hypothetical protein AB8E82_20585 [Aureispira sp.]